MLRVTRTGAARLLLPPQIPVPGPASQGQAEPGPAFLWDFTNWGSHRYPADPPLYALPLACNPDMRPLPQSPTLGRMAGVGLPVGGGLGEWAPNGVPLVFWTHSWLLLNN